MVAKKVARDKIMATKTEKKGLIIVNTGKGKGKSSDAFGMIFRCIRIVSTAESVNTFVDFLF